jgi:L-iditol 2-dehydrogenase
MKALVYEGAQKVTLKDVPRPKLGDDTVILRVTRCAICGTDLKAITHGIASIKPPVILGHEIAGTVAEAGSRVEGFKVGDRISLAPSLPCGQCAMCARGLFNLCDHRLPVGTIIDGGFAEYLLIPARAINLGYLVKIPDSLSDDEAALCEPLACVINAQNLARVASPDVVVVIGGGPMGIINALAARARGATRVILVEGSEKRVEMVRKLALPIDDLICSAAEDPVAAEMPRGTVAAVTRAAQGRPVDVVINAAPALAAVDLAFTLAPKMGRVSLFASVPKDAPTMSIDVNNIHYKQLSVFGASDSTARDHREAVSLLASGRVDIRPIISNVYDLKDFFTAIDQIKGQNALKILIRP